jgi:hypothetical protein
MAFNPDPCHYPRDVTSRYYSCGKSYLYLQGTKFIGTLGWNISNYSLFNIYAFSIHINRSDISCHAVSFTSELYDVLTKFLP